MEHSESLSGAAAVRSEKDKIEAGLLLICDHILTLVFGFLPILIIPVAFLPLDYGKVIIAIAAISLAVLFFSFSVLRSGSIRVIVPPALIALWAVAGVGLLSAVFSGDAADALWGDLFEVNTALFLILLAVVGSLSSLIKFSKMSIMRLYILLTASAALLGLFHVARVIVGAENLSLGLFSNSVSTSVGSWNDLGLFFGLSILLSMVALEQLPLTKWGRIVFSVGVGFSLVMLAVINFRAVWWIICLVSLVMLMYSLVKDRFGDPGIALRERAQSSLQSILLSLCVFVFSLTFIIAGGALGGKIADLTGISYLEVRPSFSATIDVARAVYKENAFFGVGPNKFVDAWRLYKDPSINQTIFWNTDFRGGNGYVTTSLVTMGILGGIAWLTFFGLFLYAGFRMLLKTVHADKFWYFIASSSFVAATYLWLMSFVYLPGATVLLLAGLFTTIMFAAYHEIVGAPTFVLSVQNNKRAVIVLVGVVMVIVVATASLLYFTGRHLTAVYIYTDTITSIEPGVALETIEQRVADAFAIVPSDVYARQVANYQLAKINSLLALTEPTSEQRQQFQNAILNGINSAQRAVDLDKTDALNSSVLGAIYSVLVAAGEDEVLGRAEEALANARRYAPQNPAFVLQEAQLQVRVQNIDRARELIAEAVRMKPNYPAALNYLAEIELATGRTEEAIAATRAIINLEPNNPARYYQLAVLQSATGDIVGSITSLERAVALNPSYANARYLLALAYAQEDRMPEAIDQLKIVRDLNPENASVSSLISEMESGQYTPAPLAGNSAIAEPQVVSQNNDSVTASEAPDTPLIKPVNTVPESSEPAADPAPDTVEQTQVNSSNTAETSQE